MSYPRTIQSAVAAAALLVLGASLAVAAEHRPAQRLEVLGAQFGIFHSGVLGESFEPTGIVPLRPGQGYGWRLRLEPMGRVLRWREELELPAAPRTWGSCERRGLCRISEDRRTSVVEGRARPQSGWLSNGWNVAAGDPAGRYVLRLYVEDVLVQTIEFDVR